MKILYITTMSILALYLQSCSVNKSTKNTKETSEFNYATNQDSFLTISLEKGKAYNHPTYAIWVEDLNGNFISTIFLTKSLSTRIFGYKHSFGYIWEADSGRSVRPATLPVWIAKADVDLNSQKDLVDGVSGATPTSNSTVSTDIPQEFPEKFRVFLEVNQTWDWNKYWTNSMYPESFEYKTSCQPSLIYAVTVDTKSSIKDYYLNPVGHGHYDGSNGELYTDLRTLTTAKEIFQNISLTINKK